jgi:hypothetical protein
MAKSNLKAVPKSRRTDVEQTRALLRKFQRESKGIVSSEYIDVVEHAFSANGDLSVSRRYALALLSKPWKDVAEQVKADREIAAALADAQRAIQKSAARYQEMADLLTSASERLIFMVCRHKDADSIFAEVDQDRARPEFGREALSAGVT